MKKVINITLGGIVFAIEDTAYEALSKYLESIRLRYEESDDYKDIADDIEGAIAEKFLHAKKNEKKAITISDVERVTAELGNVSEFGDETHESTPESETRNKQASTSKRLYRNTDDAILGGVASGIATYFDIDPVIVRVIFLLSIFLNGLGVIVYVILWLVVPEAKTTGEKYAMRGEKVTLTQITERVKKKIDDIDSENLRNSARNTWGGVRPVLVSFFKYLGLVARLVLRALRYIVGGALVVVGGLLIAAVSVSVVVIASGTTLFSLDPLGQALIAALFVNSFDGLLFLLGLSTIVLVPIIFLIITGASLLRARNSFTIAKTITLCVLWIFAIAVVAALLIRYSPHILLTPGGVHTPPACTLEAKICADGSAVGRTGPACEFAECPAPHEAEKVGLIRIDTPLLGSTITSPLQVRGEARGYWFFEGSFPIVVVNWDGLIIGEGYATAESDWMTEDYVPFGGIVEFTLPEETPYMRGTVIFRKDNPSGLPEHDDALEVPIEFQSN